MTRARASDRVRRMLAMIPWVASRPEGVPIAELCERFGVDRRTLVDDLTTASFVGLAPYTPDTQVDVAFDDGRVWVRLPQWFDRPLRLTPEQALALVAAGRSLLAVERTDTARGEDSGAGVGGPLARALDKLAATLGLDGDDATVGVRIGGVDSPVITALRFAIAEHRRARISYYAYGRDAHTARVVEPHRLYSDRGELYLWAWCRDAGAQRSFRVDRIHDLTILDEVADVEPPATERPSFSAPPGAPTITLELAPGAAWVTEQYPVESREELGGGRCRVTFAVTGRAWLERLLLRLGPEAEVVTATDPALATAGVDAARRALRRYGPQGSPDGVD